MKKMIVISAILLMAVASANANFITNPGFEANGGAGTVATGWSEWTERGSIDAKSEPGNIGAPAGNWVAGIHGSNLNGGWYQQIPVPTGVDLLLDGYWASHPTAANSQWGEVIVFDGAFTPTNGVDVNPPGQGTQNGSLLDGELIYKNDTFASPGGWSGLISANAPVQNSGPNIGQSTTGIITLIIKGGNGGANQGADFDNLTLTPEPTALMLLGLGLLPILRRRRRA